MDRAHLGLQHCAVVRNMEKCVEAKTKRTRSGWDPCRSDEEAHWDQASEERDVGMVVMRV